MKPNLYIRTDGSNKNGLGHLVRCIALAQILQKIYSINFFCRNITTELEEEILLLGYNLYKIEHENEFFDKLHEQDVVVLDGYHFDLLYQKRLKEAGVLLVCIDDLHDMPCIADLIVNHTPGITPLDFQTSPYTQFALGPAYALLRPGFLKQARKERKISKIETVLICFGGSDHKNLTLSTLETTLKFKRFRKIIVITGSAYSQLASLSGLIEKNIHVEHYHAVDEEQMIALMQAVEVAIVPASGILLEAFASKLMIISGMYVDNQKWLYERYKAIHAFIDAGRFSSSSLTKALTQLFELNFETNANIIDGYSDDRLRKVIGQINKLNSFTLRKAVDKDLSKTFQWASNQTVRLYSFNQHQISFEEHSRWFNTKIKNDHCVYLIAEDQSKQYLGCIRFDIKNRQANINYLIDPLFHGQGYGTALLAKGIAYLYEHHDTLHEITGSVMRENIPSLKAFERLGFKSTEENNQIRFEKQVKR